MDITELIDRLNALEDENAALKAKAALADEMAAAAREWLRAREYRQNLPVPFGATPLTHPEVFNNALASAKEGNRLLEIALAHYDALDKSVDTNAAHAAGIVSESVGTGRDTP